MRIDVDVKIVDADLSDPGHQIGLLDVLDSYAADPVGGGEPLSAAVRERLVPALRSHPTLGGHPKPAMCGELKTGHR